MTTETADPLSGTVHNITGDFMPSGAPKESPSQAVYDINKDHKTTAPQHGYTMTPPDGQPRHLYDLTPDSKVSQGHPTFNHPQDPASAESSGEYITHSASPDVQQPTVLVNQQQEITENLDDSIKIHNLSAKLKTE